MFMNNPQFINHTGPNKDHTEWQRSNTNYHALSKKSVECKSHFIHVHFQNVHDKLRVYMCAIQKIWWA